MTDLTQHLSDGALDDPAITRPKLGREHVRANRLPMAKGKARLEGVRPVAARFPISVEYGVRGSLWAAGYHTGIDYACPDGTHVRCPRAGRVVLVGTDDIYGAAYGLHAVVEVEGVHMLFAHLSGVADRVRPGHQVSRGEHIAKSGHSGDAWGAHLHFEVRNPPYHYGRDDFNPHVLLHAGWLREHSA